MGAMTSQITSLTNVYSSVHSGADQRNITSSTHKWTVTRKMFSFDDVIMDCNGKGRFFFVLAIICGAVLDSQLKTNPYPSIIGLITQWYLMSVLGDIDGGWRDRLSWQLLLTLSVGWCCKHHRAANGASCLAVIVGTAVMVRCNVVKSPPFM